MPCCYPTPDGVSWERAILWATVSGGLTDFVPQHLTREAAAAALEAVPDRVLEAAVVWGDRSDVIEAAQRLADAGLRHLVLHDVPALPGPPPGSGASRFELIEAVRREVDL